MQRYEITEHCITVSNTPVYRVRYLTDSPDHGGKGSLGGYIRDEEVLPHNGTGVILGDAVATGGTIRGGVVLGYAVVTGGTIYDGVIYGGEIHGGEIHDGEIYGGEIYRGEIHGGEIRDGVIHGGIWHCEPLTMYPGRHPMYVCDYNSLKIGCMRYSINYWLTNAADVGRENVMDDADIELYVSMIHTAKRWHDYVTSRGLLLPQKTY
jgi:hypothetical protein